MARFFVVWNENKTEGFITNDADDASYAADGFGSGGCVVSMLAQAMRDAYCDDDEDMELPTSEIEVPE